MPGALPSHLLCMVLGQKVDFILNEQQLLLYMTSVVSQQLPTAVSTLPVHDISECSCI